MIAPLGQAHQGGAPRVLPEAPPGLVRKAISDRGGVSPVPFDMAKVTILPGVLRVKRVLPVKGKSEGVCHSFASVWCPRCLEREEREALRARRGRVEGFSRRAKRRMMDRLDELDWVAISIPGDKSKAGGAGAIRGAFWTLTYSDFGNDWKGWKRDLKNFWKAARRKYGSDISCVWKLESQGNRAFRMNLAFVPHFHLAVDLKREHDLRDMRKWLSATWFRIAGRGNQKHFMAGTNCQPIYNEGSGKLRGYLSKYLAKVEKAEAETGRIWGECGAMVEAERVEGFTSWTQSVRRLRQVRPENDYLSTFGKKPIVHGQSDGRDFKIFPTVFRFDGQDPGQLLRGIFRQPKEILDDETPIFTGSLAFA